MNIELTQMNIIKDLHERGYNNDFSVSGNGILSVQQKEFISAADIVIQELHRLYKNHEMDHDVIILGVSSISQSLKGILIINLMGIGVRSSQAIVDRISEFFFHEDYGN